MTEMCHITPTKYLDCFAKDRTHHLTLAHLVESDHEYRQWYYDEMSKNPDAVNIMDNSAFEMYKQGRLMYPSDKLIEMGRQVKADYIVLTDYPAEPYNKTIDKAIETAPEIKQAGFGTFFAPQSEIGDISGLINSFEWAANNPDLIDYIGISILATPNAYGVERNNKLQRFLSRWHFIRKLDILGTLQKIKQAGIKIHMLGMVDGPNEIDLVSEFLPYIDTWDSSAAVWAGLCGIQFDNSPTGLINGKNEIEVDFAYDLADKKQITTAWNNVFYIDRKIQRYNMRNIDAIQI